MYRVPRTVYRQTGPSGLPFSLRLSEALGVILGVLDVIVELKRRTVMDQAMPQLCAPTKSQRRALREQTPIGCQAPRFAYLDAIASLAFEIFLRPSRLRVEPDSSSTVHPSTN